MKALFYCTKGKPYLIGGYHKPYYLDKGGKYAVMDTRDNILNGKIVAECDFEVEKMLLKPGPLSLGIDGLYYVCEKSKLSGKDGTLNKKCQLTNRELVDYLVFDGYAIHIKNLHIFDEPEPLEYYEYGSKYVKIGTRYYKDGTKEIYPIFDSIKKAPQNMAEVIKYPVGKAGKFILISIRPEWLCKILNGEKTIEVRKKVLKEMLKNE